MTYGCVFRVSRRYKQPPHLRLARENTGLPAMVLPVSRCVMKVRVLVKKAGTKTVLSGNHSLTIASGDMCSLQELESV